MWLRIYQILYKHHKQLFKNVGHFNATLFINCTIEKRNTDKSLYNLDKNVSEVVICQ